MLQPFDKYVISLLLIVVSILKILFKRLSNFEGTKILHQLKCHYPLTWLTVLSWHYLCSQINQWNATQLLCVRIRTSPQLKMILSSDLANCVHVDIYCCSQPVCSLVSLHHPAFLLLSIVFPGDHSERAHVETIHTIVEPQTMIPATTEIIALKIQPGKKMQVFKKYPKLKRSHSHCKG